jgi:hypothetical protein
VPSWMSALAISAAITGSQGTSPSAAHAIALPTSTGVLERESVRGRAAMIQEDRVIIHSMNG